jgi:hypothetical protein
VRTYRQLLVLPVFLLAIALQVSLPAAMVRAAAEFAPLVHAAICSGSTDDDPADAGSTPRQHKHNLCPACQITAAPHAALATEPAIVRPIVLVAERSVFDPSQSVGPRGPPRYGPQARARPSLS